MKFSIKIGFLLFIGLLLIAFPGRVWAQAGFPGNSTQTDSPTTAPTAAPSDLPKGAITGKIINKNDSSKPVGDLEVMLHVLDQDMNQLGMLHGKSVQDGSFTIADVPFQAGMGYAAAVVYGGTTYYSQVVPAEAGKTSLSVDVPVFESTTDLSKVQVDQMHVLFSFAQDGLEVQELFALSNLGDRTVKNGVDVPGKDGVKAAVRFPLPEKAEYINFQPQDEARFRKFPGGFADLAPLVPGQMVSQFVVNYLVPYTIPQTYQFETVLPVQRVSFVIPKESGVTLKGAGLGEPEQVTSQEGKQYDLYSLENLPAGQTLDLSFEGQPSFPKNSVVDSAKTTGFSNQFPVFLGLGIFGLALIGGGAYWWVRSSKEAGTDVIEDGDLEVDAGEDTRSVDDQSAFDTLLLDIAQLDKAFEQGEVDEETYLTQRSELKSQAKAMYANSRDEIMPPAETSRGDPVSSE